MPLPLSHAPSLELTQSIVDVSGDFPTDAHAVEVTLPSTTRMHAGETVDVAYYSVAGGQVAACMTSPASEQYVMPSCV